MNQRANLPVSLPRPNPTTSYWQDPPSPSIVDYVTPGGLPSSTDTLIIGSGITGASIAWNLLQSPSPGRVVMLEARQACSGATGRNGGHTKAASYRSFLSNTSSLGLEEAIKIAKLEDANIKAVHSFAREHGIECDSWTGDTVDIIYDQAQWEAAQKAVQAMREAMPNEWEGVARYKFWKEEEARSTFHCRGKEALGAVSYEAGSLSAYKFVIGLLEMCLERGVGLFTNTPVVKIERGGDGGWVVETEKGSTRAKRVVLATNGYTAFLRKEFQGSIIPLRGQITAHRPGSNMPKEGLQTTYSFIYGNGYEYMISRPPGTKHAGDIIMGGGLGKAPQEGLSEIGNTDDSTLHPDISEYLAATTPHYFGSSWGEDHEDGRVRREWTGIMGYSPDGFPFVGEVPGEEGLWICAGFQGHGMVLCWMCARSVVEMMEGRREGLEEWFPRAWEVSGKRLTRTVQGSLYVKPAAEVD